MENDRDEIILEIEGYKISLSNLNKALWPAEGKRPALTKRDLIKYLVRVSSFILPHLLDRPITLSRYPDGIKGEHFWQRHWNHPVPDFVKTVPLSEHGGTNRDYLLCNNLASLVWLGQQANIDLHAWFSRISPEPGLKTSGEKHCRFLQPVS